MLKETLYFKESSLEHIIFAILEGGTCALIYNRTVKMGNLELFFFGYRTFIEGEPAGVCKLRGQNSCCNQVKLF